MFAVQVRHESYEASVQPGELGGMWRRYRVLRASCTRGRQQTHRQGQRYIQRGINEIHMYNFSITDTHLHIHPCDFFHVCILFLKHVLNEFSVSTVHMFSFECKT